MKTEIGKGVWNESEGGVVRSKKQTGWETVDHWHARGGGLWSNDWLEDKKKNRPSLQTGRVWHPGGVTPLNCFWNVWNRTEHPAGVAPPCRVFKIPILRFLRCDIPNRVSWRVFTWREYVQQRGGLLSNDWLKKTELDYKRDVCDALVVSRPWNVCLQ